ncbi:ATP-binding protein [Pseudonocardia sp. T1-2H]|uniref:ATP-binding protein n=1 Tax=Pseudonocardia sp. T1-2H TaxID=3128899 RepID=UPI003100D181
MLPVSPDAAEGFYRLVDAAYERRSLAVSSNLHPSGFDEIMPKTLVTATVDRLLHHAHILVTQGDSYRLAQATSGKGVSPLTLAPRGNSRRRSSGPAVTQKHKWRRLAPRLGEAAAGENREDQAGPAG